MRTATLIRLMGFWPPFWGAGISVTHASADLRNIRVRLKLRFWNRNYVGTQFGGSLYSMVDPFYMLMLMENLGRDYIVWDKAATIRFKKPGRGPVTARFELTGERVEEIRQLADAQEKVEPTFLVSIQDDSGETVAEAEKLLYVRRKDRART